ncbi:MAG: immunoglobulin domain-containing protein [Verrucomicrobia bacterium]|nr:immunoglobulin domain-containing protein [Verrucomicrobiota bacterium]
MTINTNLGGPGYISGTPTTPGTYPVTLYAGFEKQMITAKATITILPGAASPPAITTQPTSQTVNAGANVTFLVAATGTDPLSYQWKKDGADVGGATSATLTRNSVTASDAGSYTVVVSNLAGSATSSAATLTVNVPPSITTQPAGQTVNAGANVTFTVAAAGTAPLSYQWRKDGADLAGATSATLARNSVTASDAGSYTVVVSNVAGSATSSAATLTVNVPPSITTQPASQTVNAGVNVTFSVAASGTGPLSYQWKKDNVNIAGATGATLTLNGVTTSQSGSYTVVVSNVAGSATSSAATLTVNVLPSITTQPASQTVNEGVNVTFSVAASGTAPLSYQWKKDNVNIAGATGATLTLNAVTPSQSGSYTVVVSNVAGSSASTAATLTVQQPFEVKLRFAASAILNGHFKCSLTGPINSSYIIWASSDLVHWTAVQTNRVVDGTSEYVDPTPLGSGLEFYRATIAP